MATSREPFLKAVELRNYKSIRSCTVELRPLTLLVGRNGSGKSNFLDSLRFVRDSLENSLEWALRRRGGLGSICHRPVREPATVSIRLRFNDSRSRAGIYELQLGQAQGGKLGLQERLVIKLPGRAGKVSGFERIDDELQAFSGGEPILAPALVEGRLYLGNAAGHPEFEPVFEGLTRTGFYGFEANALAELAPVSSDEPLAENGANLAGALRTLLAEDPGTVDRIVQYLAVILPGLENLHHLEVGTRETVGFELAVEGGSTVFEASSMSDGTLRALGVLLAVNQRTHGDRMALVGIEEPEAGLHPAAVGVLIDALAEASLKTQVLLTSHSPELLDELEEEQGLLVVVSEQGETRIGPIDPVGRSAIEDEVYGAGEMLRMDQLQPEWHRPDEGPEDGGDLLAPVDHELSEAS